MTTCNLPTTEALLKFLGKRRADMIQDISREDLRHCGGDSLFDIMLKLGWMNDEGETCVIVNVEGFDTQRDYLEVIRSEFDLMSWKGYQVHASQNADAQWVVSLRHSDGTLEQDTCVFVSKDEMLTYAKRLGGELHIHD